MKYGRNKVKFFSRFQILTSCIETREVRVLAFAALRNVIPRFHTKHTSPIFMKNIPENRFDFKNDVNDIILKMHSLVFKKKINIIKNLK